jgi:uncharacterized protein (TIGR02246 family)
MLPLLQILGYHPDADATTSATEDAGGRVARAVLRRTAEESFRTEVRMSKEQCTTATEADVEAINRVREAHVAALNRGDADAWVAVFSEDAVQMPPNEPANVGGDAIRLWTQAFLNQFSTQFSLSVEELQMAGDWAFERGTYTILLRPRAARLYTTSGSTSRSTSGSPTAPGKRPATSGTATVDLPVCRRSSCNRTAGTRCATSSGY